MWRGGNGGERFADCYNIMYFQNIANMAKNKNAFQKCFSDQKKENRRLLNIGY